MIIELIWIAKTKEKFVSLGLAKYLERLAGIVRIKITEIDTDKKSNKEKADIIKSKEAEEIIKRLSKGDYIIALDERGKQFSSIELSSLVNNLQNQAYKKIVFIIGGSLGLDKKVLDKANLVVSLSHLTFPHQLVRLILVEQIYRAFTILRGEPYHRQ
ncbi:MAG: 23S rRNA (pseudouridine(1915)-N(3))-methyltransferase RlmH [bacterium]